MRLAEIRKIHFVGIGGIGMSGLAELLLLDGYEVSGSDLEDSELLERLRHLGARISIGHNADSLQEAEAVVFSSAVPPDSLELVAAKNRRLPVIPRGGAARSTDGQEKGDYHSRDTRQDHDDLHDWLDAAGGWPGTHHRCWSPI